MDKVVILAIPEAKRREDYGFLANAININASILETMMSRIAELEPRVQFHDRLLDPQGYGLSVEEMKIKYPLAPAPKTSVRRNGKRVGV